MSKLLLLGVLVGFLVAGGMSYEDEVKQQELYCEMVGSGAWGDYNGNYDEICAPEQPGSSSEEESEEDGEPSGETAIVDGQSSPGVLGGPSHS